MAVRYTLRTLNGVRREVQHVRPFIVREPAGERRHQNPNRQQPDPPRFFRGQREARALGIDPANREPDPEPVFLYHTRHWWQKDPHRCQGWKKSSGTTPVQCSRRLPARGGDFCFQHTNQRRAGSAVLRERHTHAEELRARRIREHVANARREHRALVVARRRITEDRDQQEQNDHCLERHPEVKRLDYVRTEQELTGGPGDQPVLRDTGLALMRAWALPRQYRRASIPCLKFMDLSDKWDLLDNREQDRTQDDRDRQIDTISLYDRCHPSYDDCEDDDPNHQHRTIMMVKCNICRRFSPTDHRDDYGRVFPEKWMISCVDCSVRVHRHCQKTVEPWYTHHFYRCTFCLGYVYNDVTDDEEEEEENDD